MAKAKTKHISTDRITKALIASRGLVAIAAKKLKCSPNTIYARLKESAPLRQILEDARTIQVDEAESELLKAVKRGDPWAVQFTLRTQGKGRGYVERGEIRGILLTVTPEQIAAMSEEELDSLIARTS